MSQEQARRGAELDEKEAIKYGEVFANLGGSELGSKPITPRDAAAMQSAEAQVLGGIQKGGPAALMESAAAVNEQAGLVSHDAVTNLARKEGVTISVANEGRDRFVTQTVGGRVVGKYKQAADENVANKRNNNSASESGDAAEARMKPPPGFRVSIDDDFISEQGDATLNPRLLRKPDDNNFVPSESVISGIPGGMGASMATADQRVTKNK